ncbi:MAG: inosine/xanthosine triphosphatase [Candidatus Pacebacteria bacterium]|jgi:inosine/xanthosine triphosphatase|nr:inosine/xanthosine triphosphatase [Candidatus Paceibacterota bacterium]
MKINVGTANRIKLEAVEETIGNYDFLAGARVTGIDVGSGVADQPKSLEETVAGAKNRAKNSFTDCDLSVGIEDGLMAVPGTRTGYMNTSVCAFYDGKNYHLGFSAAFEYPPKAVELVESGRDINQAFYELGLTRDPKIGSAKGAIGILTKDRWIRKDTVKQSLTAALIQLDNKKLYL